MKHDSLNVLLLMDYAAPYTGNFIPSVRKLEDKIISSGGKVVFVFPQKTNGNKWVDSFIEEKRKVFFLDTRFFSKKIRLKNLVFIKKILKENHIDIIHTHFIAHNYSLLILKTFFARRIKIVGHFQNHYQPAMNYARKLKILTVKHTYDVIIGASESVAESVKSISFPEQKTRWVNSSLDTEHLKFWEEIQIGDTVSQKVVLMFAWRFKRKGVDIAIDAIKELNTKGHDIVLALAYACDDDFMRSEVLKYTGEIPSWIRFLGSMPDAASLYNNADIFLSSSREEGYTYSVLEAAYCEPMVIVSRIGGHPQDIPGSKVFELNNQEELKSALLHMIQLNEHQLTEIRNEQREYVARTYNINDWADITYGFYSAI